MAEQYCLRGFANKSAQAVLVCFAKGIRIVDGTKQVFWDKIFTGELEVPFVLETKDGDMAAGGVLNSFLTVSAIPPMTELKDDLGDYAHLEVFLDEWIKGFPGMFV